jgi:magnesium transporter
VVNYQKSVIEVVLKSKNGFEWVSLINPTIREMAQVAVQYDLNSASVHDCLEPEHLPKFENEADISFIVLRAYDMSSGKDGDTVQKLTNKIALFTSENFLITIHRRDHEYIKVLRNKWRVSHKNEENLSLMITSDLYSAILNTYESPTKNAMEMLERYEEAIFDNNEPASIIKRLYLLRRKASVYKKMLFLFNELIKKQSLLSESWESYLKEAIDDGQKLEYYSDQLYEDANNLLNIHLSLASHRTNEVMKVLTILTVFFLPLTFIVGIYGMNFNYMPEMRSDYGYAGVWVVMITISVGIYFWFRSKGWLGG